MFARIDFTVSFKKGGFVTVSVNVCVNERGCVDDHLHDPLVNPSPFLEFFSCCCDKTSLFPEKSSLSVIIVCVCGFVALTSLQSVQFILGNDIILKTKTYN